MVAEPEVMYKYAWDPRSAVRGDPEEADAIGEVLEQLCGEGRTNGELRRAALDHARSEESPLHRFPNWDDESAAEAYRLQQITNVILAIVPVNPDTGFPMEVPAFMHVDLYMEDEEGEGEEGDGLKLVGQHRSTLELLTSEEGREAMKRRGVELIGYHVDRLVDFEDMEFLVKAIRKAQRLVGLL